MNADAFVDALAKSAPTVEALQREGLSKQEATEIVRSYHAKPRKGEKHDNELLDLLSRWDMSKVEIGMVTFAKEAKVAAQRTFIGEVEADPLIMDNTTGELYVRELGTKDHVLWKAAESPAKFLDALILVARHCEKCGQDDALYDDTRAAKQAADECAAAAGGTKYREFYLMLCGAE